MDHNHETGLFRKIVCNRCNVCDSYIKYPNGYSRQAYYQANKETFKEKMKEYYQINKQRISEQDKQKIECDCGSIVRRSDISRHKRFKKTYRIFKQYLAFYVSHLLQTRDVD